MVELTGMDVLMVIADSQFRDEEYREPAAALARAKAGVDIASTTLSECTGTYGMKVKPDILITNADVNKYQAVIFVGGKGSAKYFNDKTALKIAKEMDGQGKLVCAICIAPSILANAGLLKGREATCYPSENDNLKSHGAKLIDKGVVRDGNIITANGPESAKEFGNMICDALGEKAPEPPVGIKDVDEE